MMTWEGRLTQLSEGKARKGLEEEEGMTVSVMVWILIVP
jgi:hypothetical protein